MQIKNTEKHQSRSYTQTVLSKQEEIIIAKGYYSISDLDELCSSHEGNWKRDQPTSLSSLVYVEERMHSSQSEKVQLHKQYHAQI